MDIMIVHVHREASSAAVSFFLCILVPASHGLTMLANRTGAAEQIDIQKARPMT